MLEGQLSSKEDIQGDGAKRVVCVYDVPVLHYVDDEGQPLYTREGGKFCFNEANLRGITGLDGQPLNFDPGEILSVLAGRFPNVQFVHKK